MDKICETMTRCLIVIFGGTYLLWWLVLDGPAKWDAKFHHEFEGKKLPLFIKDPIKEIGVENNKK